VCAVGRSKRDELGNGELREQDQQGVRVDVEGIVSVPEKPIESTSHKVRHR